MKFSLQKSIDEFSRSECIPKDISPDWHCETRDVFQARLERMSGELIRLGVPEERAYLFSALAGEIGNNSFDHNAGNWKDVPGVLFGYEKDTEGKVSLFLSDRGRGVLETLHKVDATLLLDRDALEVAFTKKISGRAPENRGNGLKFVKNVVEEMDIFLDFFSGNAHLYLCKGEMRILENKEKICGCLAFIYE
ncbi:MAG: hypothetical protein IPN70_01990 [Candidatus Moraniibacteriota bacterium]|nr:MAG: hypothetical protein IPN70_01990 [Candidatus Moranbacteria bacterium]